jgi:hypothetical protein
MLGAIAQRLARERVREQFAPEPPAAAPDGRSFAGRLAMLASERRLSLLLCLAGRERRVSDLAALCRFEPAIMADDLELLVHHELVQRAPDGSYRVCCSGLSAAVRRLVDLVLTPRNPLEDT